MTAKDTLDLVVKFAQLVLATIAVSPFIHKAHRLITTAPKTTQEEWFEEVSKRGRMGWGEGLWWDFLYWARRERSEDLTWREWRHRVFWCWLLRHKGEVKPWGRAGFGMTCTKCAARHRADTAELVEKWRRRGRETWRAEDQRERVDLATAQIDEFAGKLADALNNTRR